MRMQRFLLAAVLGTLLLCMCGHGMTFGIIGDWGLGGRKKNALSEIRSAGAINEACEKMKCNFTISCGDNIYIDVNEGMAASFEAMYSSQGPFFPSVGNHDNYGPQIEYTKRNNRWKFPNNYYTYSLPIDKTGYTIQVFAVNTNDGSLGGGGQLTWLEDALKKSTARWKIIFGHHPAMGSGRHKRVGTVSQINRLMSQYNVQVYFCGHDHIVEANNIEGKAHMTSGGMARGGMMMRAIGGVYTKFLLTQPGEYNKWKTDWGSHGFFTADVSPNVMAIQLWDSYGGIQYEATLPWDWMQGISKQPSNMKNEFPPPDVVKKAYLDEMKLPQGPGGGTVFEAGGKVSYESKVNTDYKPPAGDTWGNQNSKSTTPAPPIQQSNVLVTDHPRTREIPGLPKYAASTECGGCQGPSVAIPFTIYFEGNVWMSNGHGAKVYLTTSVLGCDNLDHPYILEGTSMTELKSNTAIFNASNVKGNTAVFVCYSSDGGKVFYRLRNAESLFDQTSFILRSTPPPGWDTPQPTVAQDQWVGTPPPQAEQGTSTLTFVFLGILFTGAGIVGATYWSKLKPLYSGVPTSPTQ